MSWREADVTINGHRLTGGQVMTLRVALSAFDPDCGDDEHGKRMTQQYKEKQAELLKMLIEGKRFAEGMPPVVIEGGK